MWEERDNKLFLERRWCWLYRINNYHWFYYQIFLLIFLRLISIMLCTVNSPIKSDIYLILLTEENRTQILLLQDILMHYWEFIPMSKMGKSIEVEFYFDLCHTQLQNKIRSLILFYVYFTLVPLLIKWSIYIEKTFPIFKRLNSEIILVNWHVRQKRCLSTKFLVDTKAS